MWSADPLLLISLMFVFLCLSFSILSETITLLSSPLHICVSPTAGVHVPETVLVFIAVSDPVKQLSHLLGDTKPTGLGSVSVSVTLTSLDEEAALVSTRQSDTAMPCFAGHILVSTEKAEGCEEDVKIEFLMVTGYCFGADSFEGQRGNEQFDEEFSGK